MAAFPATQPGISKPTLEKDGGNAIEPLAVAASDRDLKAALKVGLGTDGASVQTTPSFLSDREIVRRTIMKGKAKVMFQDLSLRRMVDSESGKKVKESVPKETWEEVMGASLAAFPVAKLGERGTKKTFVEFCQPPTDPKARVLFHNMLVELCQISLRRYGELMSDRQSE